MTKDRLYALLSVGLKLYSNDNSEVLIEDLTNVKPAERILIRIKEKDFNQAIKKKKKENFLEFIKSCDLKDFHVDADQAKEFQKEYPKYYDTDAKIVFFIWNAMPEIKRLYNAITRNLTSDERTNLSKWQNRAKEELTSDLTESYKYLELRHVEDLDVFHASDGQHSRDIPANLVNALLRERFNEDRGANRIKKIYINCPSSFKPAQE